MNWEISNDKLKEGRLFIATPMYNGVCNSSYAQSMVKLTVLCMKYGIDLRFYYLSNESLITRARTYAVDEFLRSESTHLMFIDADIGFEAEDVIALMALSLLHKEYSIIGAPYAKKTISWEKIKAAVDQGVADKDPEVLNRFVGDYVFNAVGSEIKLNEPTEVLELGTGFMMIPRDTFIAYADAYPELKYLPDHVRTDAFDGSREITLFFDCLIDRGYQFGDLLDIAKRIANGETVSQDYAQKLLDQEKTASKRYLSEDYNFCRNARRIGLKTYMCPWMKLTHTGTYVFGGSLMDLASIQAHPTADLKKEKK